MKITPLLSLPFFLALPAMAQLAPQGEASLYRHMVEVNAEWKHMDPALGADARPVHFRNETERIAQHLHLVERYLRTHTPQGFTARALANRSALLDDLNAYADRGLFPRNHVLPYRNPVFIDPVGTACAVGQLMIESGHRELAERISTEMNLAYVHDMGRNDVLHWATEAGFTEDELAWIQPGYPPFNTWEALGGGTNGTVTALVNLPDGTVLVAGEFTQAGGTPVQNVAVWDGNAYTALGGGVQGTITCAVAIDDHFYLGGYGLGGGSDLAEWNGTQWTYTTVFQGKFPVILALHEHAGDLYASGVVSGFVGSDHMVARRSGTMWDFVPGIFSGPVASLASHNGQLVAGGDFDSVQAGGPVVPAAHVATLTTTGWAQLGDGLDGTVLAMADAEGTLYAGGAMYTDGSPSFGLASIAPAGSAWQPLMPGLASYVPDTEPAEVRTVLAYAGGIYIGGSFTMNQLMVNGLHLAAYLGTPDNFQPLAYFNGPVDALAYDPFIVDAMRLYAGGEFTQNVDDPVAHIAAAEISTGISDPARPEAFALYPNPVIDGLHIALANGEALSGTAEVRDAQGRTVLKQRVDGLQATVDVRSLAAGTYLLRLDGAGSMRALPFIKR